MDQTENNYVRLCGSLSGRPIYSHSSRGRDFFTFPLTVLRLSGSTDRLNVVLGRELLERTELTDGARLCVTGQLRSFNNRRGEGAKLVISVFARELEFTDEEDGNRVYLRGALCRPPTLRSTPLGREICDLMLAVNRPYGRSDYLPCICWGAGARRAAELGVGARLALEGRIQSREYLKLTEQGPEHRTAFEVSASQLEELP